MMKTATQVDAGALVGDCDPTGGRRPDATLAAIASPPPSHAGRALIVVGLALIAVSFATMVPSSWRARLMATTTGRATASTPASPATQARPRTLAIELVQVGDRVVGRNPDRDQVEAALPEPNGSDWRKLELLMKKEGGHSLRIDLLRPLAWIDDVGAEEGEKVILDLAEMGALGEAEVVRIGPCPPIKRGKGIVVTGKFVHQADGSNVIKLQVEGEPEPTGVTKNHLYWSADRIDFISAGELRPGERITTNGGTARVVSVTPDDYRGLLYNLETHREHVYMVGSLGQLVHNTCAGQHHLIPKALGNPIPYKHSSLKPLSSPDHTAAHESLNAFFKTKTSNVAAGKNMYPRNGNSGAVVQQNFTKTERLNAMEEYYSTVKPELYSAYRLELDQVNKMGGLTGGLP